MRDLPAVRGRLSCADDRHGTLVLGQKMPLDVQDWRKVVRFLEARRILGVVPRDGPDARAFQLRQLPIRVDTVPVLDDQPRRSRVEPPCPSSDRPAPQALSREPKCRSNRANRARPICGTRLKATQYFNSGVSMASNILAWGCGVRGTGERVRETRARGVAERVGFEPTVPLPRHALSRRAYSSTLAPLRGGDTCRINASTGGGRVHRSACLSRVMQART